MKQSTFIGREAELDEFRLLLRKKTASLAVVQGRRRIGKSRLIEEFAKSMRFLSFTALPPEPETTAQSQRDEFARQLSEMTDLPELAVDDWGKLFSLLATATAKGRVIILLDEISWMGSEDAQFLGKLKIAWDKYFKQNPHLILILCGSVSSWIEENILSSTGFLGRTSLVMHLEELSLGECDALLTKLGVKYSAYERLKILSVTGGVPRYLEEIRPNLSVEENIKHLFFNKNGVLFKEFTYIFHDLFSKQSTTYRKIVETLVNGGLDLVSLYEKLGVKKSGYLTKYLEVLELAGFVKRDYTWDPKTGIESKLSRFRLVDNYLRFYLKYVRPNIGKIERKHFNDRAISSLAGYESIMGLQFENLILNNRHLILRKLHLAHQDVVIDNPFFQRKTSRHPGCQVDYLIQTRWNSLFICEIKFAKKNIKKTIIKQVQDKIDALNIPKGYSCLPVLIHVNGVDESVIDAGFFTEIIDATDFFS
jgi:AAA+ ATPase superfamily predicted ATPase